MASLNRVFLMGNLTRDPELRYTPKGTAIAGFGMAINRSYKTESGEEKEVVCYVDIEAWSRLAEICSQYLAKGRPVFVEGELQFDQWDDKASGQKRSKLKVRASNIQFLGSPKGGETREGGAPQKGVSPATAPSADAEEMPPEEKDDIPF